MFLVPISEVKVSFRVEKGKSGSEHCICLLFFLLLPSICSGHGLGLCSKELCCCGSLLRSDIDLTVIRNREEESLQK